MAQSISLQLCSALRYRIQAVETNLLDHLFSSVDSITVMPHKHTDSQSARHSLLDSSHDRDFPVTHKIVG